jgi:hypothetical protein
LCPTHTQQKQHLNTQKKVLTELAGDRALERFRLEYERLYRALKKSHGAVGGGGRRPLVAMQSCPLRFVFVQQQQHPFTHPTPLLQQNKHNKTDSEKRLGRKCRELNAEIVASAAKVATALKLSEEDQATIVALKREIEKSWRLVDAAHEKEAASKDAAAALRAEVAELRRAAEAGGNGGGLGPEEEAALAELLRHKEALARERDEQVDLGDCLKWVFWGWCMCVLVVVHEAEKTFRCNATHTTKTKVDQIVAMRRELAEVAERARALEAERDTMANSIAEMRQQVHVCACAHAV